ncbi:MAG: hypothetical protein PHX62_09165 [Bacilli bacterium]|nr:hypothetical protein [Bacilli bacterium]
MARPKSPKYELEFMLSTLEDYTNNTDIPILKEVCYQNYWNADYVLELGRKDDEISRAIKRLLDKKETQLERKGLNKEIDKTVAIFSLKQLGWKDKQEISFGEEQADEISIKIIKSTKEDNERIDKIEKGLFKDDS